MFVIKNKCAVKEIQINDGDVYDGDGDGDVLNIL